MPNPISANRIWKDKEVLERRRQPRSMEMHITGDGEPLRLGTALSQVLSMEHVVKHCIPGFSVPFYLAHGTEDYGVKIEGSEFMWRTVDTPVGDREFDVIDGGYHDLFSVAESQEYLERSVVWMEKRLKAMAATK